MKLISLITFLAFAIANTVSAQMLVVDSTNSAPGVFNYTFRRGPDNFVWGISPDSGSIGLQSDGVIEIQDPPGWKHTMDPTGFISWHATNGIVYLEEPVTFTVTSCLPEVQTYPPLDPHVDYAGVITGTIYRLPNHDAIGISFEGFNYIGPARTSLTIQCAATNLLISWPVTSSNFVLQAASSLDASAVWNPVTNQAVINGSNVVVAVENTNTCFFRLASPCALP